MTPLPASVFSTALNIPTALVADPGSPYVLGTGEAYPPHSYSQEEFLAVFLERYKLDAGKKCPIVQARLSDLVAVPVVPIDNVNSAQ